MRLPIAVIGGILLSAIACASYAAPSDEAGWPFAGATLGNTRDAAGAPRATPGTEPITVKNAARLALRWSATLKGAVHSATPVSDGESIFLPTALGYLSKVDAATGRTLWSVDLAEALNVPGAFVKANPAISGDTVVVGLENAAAVAALDKNTGAVRWMTRVDDLPVAVITQSPIVFDGHVFIGVAGLGEEVQATYPTYKCCQFRGSMLSLDLATGKILWKTYLIPEGFAGASVWSSTPAIDPKRQAVYIATGNGFHAPADVQQCLDRARPNHAALRNCYPPGVWYDSILALDMASGKIKWGQRLDDFDIFTGACLVPETGAAANCGGGDDWDFGNGVMIWRAGGHDLIGAGQKSGVFWALDPDTGKIAWQTTVGPGGPNGGMEMGSATDGSRVYAAEGDTKQIGHDSAPYRLPSGEIIKYGSFAALDAATGRIDWQIADPAGAKYPGNDLPCKLGGPKENCVGAYPKGPVSVANGVVFACSTDPEGHLYAFDAASGAVIWSLASGSACASGASIVGNTVYWANGRTLSAFSVPAAGTRFAVAHNSAVGEGGVTTASGVFTAAQADRGRMVYAESCAAGCHLPNLAGGGPTPDLAGAGFLSRWDGLSVADLFKKISSTMPKASPGSLDQQDYLAVTAFLLLANGMKPGSQALAVNGNNLGKIEITAAP